MDFLAILFALGCLQFWGSGGPVQQDAWFSGLRAMISSSIAGPIGRIVSILAPVLLLASLEGVLRGAGFGLVELLLLLVVLLYSLGRGDLTHAVAEYLARWRRGDFEGAYETLQLNPVTSPDNTVIDDPTQLHGWVRRRIYYRSFERLFAVLFWFFVLGAAGALLYRLALLDEQLELEGESQLGEVSERETFPVVYWLEWLPARLLGLSFALIGHFDGGLSAWKRGVSSATVDAAALLEGCGNGALQIGGMMHTDDTTDALIRRGCSEIEAVEELQRRSVVVWVVAIAVLELLL